MCLFLYWGNIDAQRLGWNRYKYGKILFSDIIWRIHFSSSPVLLVTSINSLALKGESRVGKWEDFCDSSNLCHEADDSQCYYNRGSVSWRILEKSVALPFQQTRDRIGGTRDKFCSVLYCSFDALIHKHVLNTSSRHKSSQQWQEQLDRTPRWGC